MGEFTEKAKGETNEAIGNTKQAIGEATNSPTLTQDGLDQEARGELQEDKDDVEGAVGNEL